MVNRNVLSVVIAGGFLLAVGTTRVNAQVNETGDAGTLPGQAQSTSGVGPLTTISGSLGGDPFTDVDTYKITITDPANFSAIVTAGNEVNQGPGIDSILYLFAANGAGAIANDDIGGDPYSGASHLDGPLAHALSSGTYYLSMTNYYQQAQDAAGTPIFTTLETDGTVVVTGSGVVAQYVKADQNTDGVGPYTITLTGASFSQAPEPATLSLLAFGSFGLLSRRRHR